MKRLLTASGVFVQLMHRVTRLRRALDRRAFPCLGALFDEAPFDSGAHAGKFSASFIPFPLNPDSSSLSSLAILSDFSLAVRRALGLLLGRISAGAGGFEGI
eukprot:CAMPEP_0196667286 /NCGR_PEP_ID=MMETSP1086-20130531/64999_1 /TAXON_ID=77921 /ORGANISM="Cyanoptyche  gloeocystis , Strain SAG4.97" /LENGTH=101 /DNA_ID=CAMNT_0042004601 /DNA_START=820 /DNA_END=1125 /DNA_ORIENTATION=+